MDQSEEEPVALRRQPRLQVVDARDMAVDQERGQIAEAQQAALHAPRQLELHPDLGQSRAELRHHAHLDVAQCQRFPGRLRRHDVERQTARQRVPIGDQGVERDRDLSREARDPGLFQSQEVTVDCPAPCRQIDMRIDRGTLLAICSPSRVDSSFKLPSLATIVSLASRSED